MPFATKLVKFVLEYREPCLVTAATTIFSAGALTLAVHEFKNFEPTETVDPQ